jgi:GH24 family phage-related lysozyme (muramidase)
MESNGKIGCSNKVVKIVDPNDFDGFSSTSNVSVPLEDLNISVVLRTKRKGRTVLSSDGELKTTESNGTVEINFIEGSDVNGKKVLTSKFTDLTTIYDASFNEETLGISSIDIDFNASMAPMITINFIDVRGSSIFQNEKNISGNNSANKYATFFQLPYPLFELEVKGYYGLPVTYCLHMLKFTTKFNSRTGNFEIQCQFIGYTYAMLSDMLIGYLRAIKETKIGSELYKAKNDARVAAGGRPVLGLVELTQAINDINKAVTKVASESEESETLNTVTKGLEALEGIKNELDLLGSNLDIEKGNTKSSYKFILNKNTPDDENIIKSYYEGVEQTITAFNNINAGYSIDVKKFKDITTPGTDKGFYTDLSVEKLKTTSEEKERLIEDIGSENGYNKFIEEINKYIAIHYRELASSFDVYNMTSLYNELEKAKNEIEKTTINAKEGLALKLKNTVRTELGFEPTVRNIVEIFTFAAEIFMETIYKVSAEASSDSPRKDELENKFKIELKDDTDLTKETKEAKIFHPWPDYREKDEKSNTFIEKYLGSPGVLENPNNVTEIRFIDDLLNAFLKAKKSTDEVDQTSDDVDSTWYPVNPIDTKIYVSEQPYDRQELINKPDVLTMAVIRGMTFLGYTNDFNSLSIESEIIPMANLEAEAILRSIKDEKLKNSLGLVTLDSFKKISNKINGKDSKVLVEYDKHQFYQYIYNYAKTSANATTPLIIPINDGFKGEWGKDANSLRGRAQRGSVFLSNNPGKWVEIEKGKPSIMNKFDNGGKHIEIITPEEYDKTINLYSSETEINTESVLVLEKLKSEIISDPKSAGFNVFGGPHGIQDFSKMNFGSNDLKDLPLRFVFFNDHPKGGGLALTRKATSASEKVNFITSDDYKKDGLIKNNTSFGFYKDFNANILHKDLTNNRKFFKKLLDGSKDITYPYIYVSVDAESKGNDSSVSYGNIYDDSSSDKKFSLFGSKFYYMQDRAKITPKALKKPYYTKEYARAILFLNSLPWIGNGFGVDGDRFNDPEPINEIMHLFDVRGGFVHAPKLWCAYVGGILWRLDNSEPKIEDNKITGGGSTESDPISWYFDKDETFKVPLKTEYFPSIMFMNFRVYPSIVKSDGVKSGDILRRMPLQAINEFKRIFFEFVNGGGSGVTWDSLKSKLEIFDGTSAQFIKFIDDNKAQNKRTEAENKTNGFNASRLDKLINKNNYSKILFESSSDAVSRHSLFLELKDGSPAVNKLLDALLEEVIIVNTSFQAFKSKNYTNTTKGGGVGYEVVVSNIKFEKYFETIVKKLNEKANVSSPLEEKKADEIELFGTANEDVIKLILYKNCKNIYDKWLAGVNDINKIIFQCGINTRNQSDKEIGLKYGNTVPSLIDSFRFVSRSFKDIGDRLYINPIPVNNYLSNDQNRSLYDAVSDLLTENKFTFEALPTFINFRNDENVKAIFTPYGNYGEALASGSCGPSFVCVYAGQPSKHLDFKKSEYQNDGFDLNCVSSSEKGKAIVNPSVPEDFLDSYQKPIIQSGFENQDTNETETNGVSENISGSEDPIAVFTVRYGQQNQNIFKDVELDQSEFTETDESLQIQEEISQKGSENNRTIAGQNIYNVYSVRSYSAKVEMLGNAMIQPMMYFQLDNIPMFHGAYMVTRVQHSITPNTMKTTFTGTRIRYSETPLMTAYDLYMSFADTLDTSGAGSGGVTPSGNFIPRYKADLVKNKPKDTTIIGTLTDTQKNGILKRAQQEIKNWQNGKLKESNGTQFLDVYAKATPGISGENFANNKEPWSGVFISYIMLGGDKSFPKSASHYDYITAAMNGKAGYEVFPFKSGLKIKVERGDIFNKPRSGGPRASHSDVVYSVSGEKAYLVGGNLSDSIGLIEINLKNGYIDDSVDVGDYVLIMKQTDNKYYNSKKLLGTGNYDGYTGAKKVEDLKPFSLTLKSVYTGTGYKDDWSAIAANFIATKEGYSPKATKDAGTYRGGYGTDKKLVNGVLTTVTSTTTFTEKEAVDTLRFQIAGSYSQELISNLGKENWNKLNKHQKAALVSLSWNAGSGYITKPYGKEIKSSIADNDFKGGAQGILNGPVTSDGKVLKGLQIRREQEAQLFLHPKDSAITYS